MPALTYTRLAADSAKAGFYGVFREADPIRTYPNGSVGSSVVGFVGADGKGLGGLELSMNQELSGKSGTETYESAPNGSKIPLGDSKVTPGDERPRTSGSASTASCSGWCRSGWPRRSCAPTPTTAWPSS